MGARLQTTVHVLSACPVALNQDRLTWRYDGIVNYIAQSEDTSKFSIHADLPEFNTPAGGTIPPSLTVTFDIQDLVIIDEKKREVAIFRSESSSITCAVDSLIHSVSKKFQKPEIARDCSKKP